MPTKSIGTILNIGWAGAYSRTPDCIVEAKTVKSDSANIEFGKAVVLNGDNTFSSAASVTITAANFAGVALSTVKQDNTAYGVGTSDNHIAYYAPLEQADVLQRGIVTVYVQRASGSITAGGTVYVRKSTPLTGIVIGGFEGAADGADTVALTNCSWNTGYVDANGMAELKIKTVNN